MEPDIILETKRLTKESHSFIAVLDPRPHRGVVAAVPVGEWQALRHRLHRHPNPPGKAHNASLKKTATPLATTGTPT